MLKDKDLIAELEKQAVKRMQFARTYKQGKVRNWQKNEGMYYGVKTPVQESRANVELGRMQEFVHALQSKIDDPQIFKFLKRKEAQLKRVKRLNALRDVDKNNDFWDIKTLVGKKQLIIYGRMIFSYFADSIEGYKSHLGNVDVYDFLIDPSGGGIDLEMAEYMGDYGVVFNRKDLEDGIKGRNPMFLKDQTEEILDGVGNNTEMPQEETNKRVRMYGQNTIGQKEIQNDDKFKFWRWFDTFEGERYYLVMQGRAGKAIRAEKLTDLISPTKRFPKSPWPYWTAAAFPDLTEFWTPGHCDYVREIFMAQGISVNQGLDNSEEINKPQRVINVNSIENLAELKYRRSGYIKVKNDVDATKAVQELRPPEIETPIKMFNLLEGIHQKASGVTDETTGTADDKGQVGIYEGNQRATAGRFDLLDKSIAFGMDRFGRLYEIGVRDNLTKKVAIDMIGPDGIETEEITRKDIFRKDDDFNMIVESSNAEEVANIEQQSVKIKFIDAKLADPIIGPILNKQKAFEIEAKILELDDDDIKQLLDTSEYGNAELLSEAARDIEDLLEGEDVKPNPAANNAYKQKIVNWMVDHQEDMTTEQFDKMANYVKSLTPIITKNEARALNQHATNLSTMAAVPPAARPTAPVPVLPSNAAPGAPNGQPA